MAVIKLYKRERKFQNEETFKLITRTRLLGQLRRVTQVYKEIEEQLKESQEREQTSVNTEGEIVVD